MKNYICPKGKFRDNKKNLITEKVEELIFFSVVFVSFGVYTRYNNGVWYNTS